MTPRTQKQEDLIRTRLKELLGVQQDRFQVYLRVLHTQKGIITQGRAEDLLVLAEQEEQILGEILAVQQVIPPLEALYQNQHEEILRLKQGLAELRQAAQVLMEQNKDLLAQRMAQTASDIKALRESPLRKGRSPYTVTPSFIDLAL